MAETKHQQLSSVVKTSSFVFGLYLVGTLVLPVGTFDRYRGRPDDWLYVVGTGLAFDTPWNRGVILGACAMIAACIFALMRVMKRPTSITIGHVRPSLLSHLCLLDTCIIAWIAVPTIAGIFNPSLLGEDLWQSVYLAIAWGGPYLAARLTSRSTDDAKSCLWIVLCGGLITAVPALLELVFGRFVYQSQYGYHPNQSIGEFKFFGTRPLLCFEDPNQIAMWWMTVALAAILLVPKWSLSNRDAGLKWGAVSLPFLFQGVGASILTVTGLVVLSLTRIVRRKTVLVSIAVIATLLFLARGPILRLGRDVAQKAALEEPIKRALQDTPIGSMAWRLVREEEVSRTFESNLLFGSGTVLFWQGDGAKFRPWGFVSLVNGAYGFFGVAVVMIWFAFPFVAFTLGSGTKLGRRDIGHLDYGLAILWGLHGVDALVNPAFFLPTVFLMGTLPSLNPQRFS